MKTYHVFWFGEYYPSGGIADYAGSINAETVDEVKEKISDKLKHEKHLGTPDGYQIADTEMNLIEDGRMKIKWGDDGNTVVDVVFFPDESIEWDVIGRWD